jgi:hypothetical protein
MPRDNKNVFDFADSDGGKADHLSKREGGFEEDSDEADFSGDQEHLSRELADAEEEEIELGDGDGPDEL